MSFGGRIKCAKEDSCDEHLAAVVHLQWVTPCETIARSCGQIHMVVVHLLRMTLIYQKALCQEDTLETSVGGRRRVSRAGVKCPGIVALGADEDGCQSCSGSGEIGASRAVYLQWKNTSTKSVCADLAGLVIWRTQQGEPEWLAC